ncbi:hypothetical protein CNR22_20515 [Sphingobacteriaceae bacterium]|nr:hypothetical protein CNR22_20515 [Sphingobacteriaceae bacterium]
MLKAARITIFKARKTIVFFSALNFLFFIGFMMLVKYTGLLHITGLRTVNYVFLTVFSLLHINRLIKELKGYIPFLQVMSITFFTGTISFFLFSIFLFFYSFSDPYLNSMFIMDTEGMSRLVPPLLVFFEGSGISIIVGLITMIYSEKFSDKETAS